MEHLHCRSSCCLNAATPFKQFQLIKAELTKEVIQLRRMNKFNWGTIKGLDDRVLLNPYNWWPSLCLSKHIFTRRDEICSTNWAMQLTIWRFLQDISLLITWYFEWLYFGNFASWLLNGKAKFPCYWINVFFLVCLLYNKLMQLIDLLSKCTVCFFPDKSTLIWYWYGLWLMWHK